MATIFVIDLERRICIARGSNVEVLAKNVFFESVLLQPLSDIVHEAFR